MDCTDERVNLLGKCAPAVVVPSFRRFIGHIVIVLLAYAIGTPYIPTLA